MSAKKFASLYVLCSKMYQNVKFCKLLFHKACKNAVKRFSSYYSFLPADKVTTRPSFSVAFVFLRHLSMPLRIPRCIAFISDSHCAIFPSDAYSCESHVERHLTRMFFFLLGQKPMSDKNMCDKRRQRVSFAISLPDVHRK